MDRTPEEYTLRAIENLLSKELDNWIRWAGSRDYLPQSFKCPLAFLFKPPLGEVYSGPTKRPEVDLKLAAAFEDMVVHLPVKHRMAFVMHHLYRAHENGRIVFLKKKDNTVANKARLLEVSNRQYHNIVWQAHEMALRRWNAAVQRGRV